MRAEGSMLPSGHFVVKMGVYRAFRDSVAMRIFFFFYGTQFVIEPIADKLKIYGIVA